MNSCYFFGKSCENVLDTNGDLSVVKSQKNQNSGFWNYAEHFTYNAAGAVTSMQLGNGRWESTQFNSRLQPTQIALGSIKYELGLQESETNLLKLNYDYGSTANNGNILSQTIKVPTEIRNSQTYNGFTATQTYTYDELNRIHDAKEVIGTSEQWKQTFVYDRYGNRTFDEALTTTLPKNCTNGGQQVVCQADNPSANVQDNRLSGVSFDASGNTTKDANSRKFTYDGENKQTKVETVDLNGTVTGLVGQYWYDGDGKRVRKYAHLRNVFS